MASKKSGVSIKQKEEVNSNGRIGEQFIEIEKHISDGSRLFSEEKIVALMSSPSDGAVRFNGIRNETDRLIRIKEVLEILPISKSCWWSWVASGKAPQPIRLGRCTCWKYIDILAFTAK